MKLEDLKRNWDLFGRTDPLWSICTEPGTKGNRWDEDEFFETGRKEIDEVFERLESIGVPVTPGTALDFGCGIGRLSRALCARFGEVVGVDIAPSMIELANERNAHPGRCRFLLNDRPDLLLFGEGCFDFVYSSITLQHMEPGIAESYLKEFVRVLKPGGLLVFQVPDSPDLRYPGNRIRKAAPASILGAYRRLRYPGNRPRMEMHELPRDRVTGLLENSGAEVLDVSPDASARRWNSYRYFARRHSVP